MIQAIAELTLYIFALYGLVDAMFEVKDWLARKYNNNPPYLIRFIHMAVVLFLVFLITKAM